MHNKEVGSWTFINNLHNSYIVIMNNNMLVGSMKGLAACNQNLLEDFFLIDV